MSGINVDTVLVLLVEGRAGVFILTCVAGLFGV